MSEYVVTADRMKTIPGDGTDKRWRVRNTWVFEGDATLAEVDRQIERFETFETAQITIERAMQTQTQGGDDDAESMD